MRTCSCSTSGDEYEFEISNIGGHLIPLPELPKRLAELDTTQEIVAACKMGARGVGAVEILQGKGSSSESVRFKRNSTNSTMRFLFEEKIDSETYERQRDRLREEMTVAKMAKHSSELDELDVEGILAFAEHVLPRASDVWIQASLAQRQQLQKLFFPEGIRFDGTSIVRTPPRPSAFNWLEAFRPGEKGVVALTYARSSHLVCWLQALDRLRSAA